MYVHVHVYVHNVICYIRTHTHVIPSSIVVSFNPFEADNEALDRVSPLVPHPPLDGGVCWGLDTH